jgi:hypothetical protein
MNSRNGLMKVMKSDINPINILTAKPIIIREMSLYDLLTKTKDSETIKILRTLSYSRHKLLDKDIPMQLRATSYLRISCSSLKKLDNLESLSIEMQLQDIQFSLLLKSLTEYDSRWWDRCTVSSQGVLKSENSVIESLLEPLTQIHLYCCPIT